MYLDMLNVNAYLDNMLIVISLTFLLKYKAPFVVPLKEPGNIIDFSEYDGETNINAPLLFRISPSLLIKLSLEWCRNWLTCCCFAFNYRIDYCSLILFPQTN